MRKKTARILLIISVITWGIYCGGQIFNELMVVPRWSAAPPETIKAYNAIPKAGGADFFEIFGPLFIFLALIAAVFAWKSARKSRKWLLPMVAIALSVLASLLLYLVPLVRETHLHALAGDLPAAEIVARVETWKFGNRVRLITELLGFVCSVIALNVWSAETDNELAESL